MNVALAPNTVYGSYKMLKNTFLGSWMFIRTLVYICFNYTKIVIINKDGYFFKSNKK
jgi:hypothetical protein